MLNEIEEQVRLRTWSKNLPNKTQLVLTWFSSDWNSEKNGNLKTSAGDFCLWQAYRDSVTLTYIEKVSLHKCKVLKDNFCLKMKAESIGKNPKS